MFWQRPADSSDFVVLTIASRFPSLIQPWLVSHLVQVEKNGGENRVISQQAETVYSQNVDKFGLRKKSVVIPMGRLALIRFVLSSLVNWNKLACMMLGICRLPRVFRSRLLSPKMKLKSLAMLPCLGLRGVSVVHSHSEMVGHRFLPIIVALNVPLVVTFHGLPPAGVRPLSAEERNVYTTLADVILVNTNFAKRQYEALGAPGHKIRVIPQGLMLDDFPFRERNCHAEEPLTVLSVGRYHRDKGQEYIIDAMGQWPMRDIRVRVIFVGGGPDLERLQAKAAELDDKKTIEFQPSQRDSELRELYGQAHVFILASVRSQNGGAEETQGVVLQEAQASGLIVIATRTGGIPECLDDGVSAFLIPDRDALAIAQTLKDISLRKDDWPYIQRAGRQWVERFFSAEVIGKKNAELYRSLSGARQS